MPGDISVPASPQDAAAWAAFNFGGAELGDRRLSARLVKIAAAACAKPGTSIPDQGGDWAHTKGAYRFYSHPKIDHDDLQSVHTQRTRERCRGHAVVLLVQDTTELNYSRRADSMRGLTSIGDGTGRGLHLHNTLAVTTGGGVLGLMDQRFFDRPEPGTPKGTRTEQLKGWRESLIWSDTVRGVGPPPQNTRWVYVCDSASDSFDTITACDEQKIGFLLRARCDRNVDDRTATLWKHCEGWPVRARVTVEMSAKFDRGGKLLRPAGTVELEVRWGTARLDPPRLRPDCFAPRLTSVAYLREVEDVEHRVDWLLLTDEAVETLADALRLAEWYAHRWKIEEYHRALKEGCRIEDVQFDQADDVKRYTRVMSVVAVRLMQLRDAARGPQAENPAALREIVEPAYIQLAAGLAKVAPETMTPRLFIRTIAKRGGFLGRKRDGEPGWKTIWRGWLWFEPYVKGFEAAARGIRGTHRCG